MAEIREELEDDEVGIQFEVSDEPNEAPTPADDPISTRLAQLEAENSRLKESMASYGGQKDLIEGLSKAISGQKPPENVSPQAQKTFEQELESIKDELLDTPDKALKRYGELLIKHEIAPVVGMLNNEIMSMRSELDRGNISSDPVFKDVLDNYSAEVEAQRAELAKSGVRDSLKQAVNQVAMGHMTEIIGRQVANAGQNVPDGPSALKGMESGSTGRRAEPKVVRLTSRENQEREMLGLSYEDYVTVKGGR